MNMIERVAQAIVNELSYDSPEMIKAAKAAIAAMREPTEEMIKMGANCDDDYFDDFKNGYIRMIDAALKE